MSVFRPETIVCSTCGHRNVETVAVSLHGSRVPHIIRSIVEGSFQCFNCAACGQPYRADGPILYIDFDRKRWIGAFPASLEPSWANLEQQPMDCFRQSLIDLAPRILRGAADGFTVRAVFGLHALAEKVLLLDAGIDDRLVELAKFQFLLQSGAVLSPAHRPRVLRVDADAVQLMVWLEYPAAEQVPRGIEVPVTIGKLTILAEDPRWAPVLAELNIGPYVDVGRLLLDGRQTLLASTA